MARITLAGRPIQSKTGVPYDIFATWRLMMGDPLLLVKGCMGPCFGPALAALCPCAARCASGPGLPAWSPDGRLVLPTEY